jgi:hypothetical protein
VSGGHGDEENAGFAVLDEITNLLASVSADHYRKTDWDGGAQ